MVNGGLASFQVVFNLRFRRTAVDVSNDAVKEVDAAICERPLLLDAVNEYAAYGKTDLRDKE